MDSRGLSEKLEREVLPLVARPGRYTGAERNVSRKVPGDVRAGFLLAFPDVYEIGMSHLGLRMLYDILDRRDDLLVERVFAPWTDMEARMRAAGIPLFSIESRRPASEFDIIGFTLQYELHYTNVLTMLDVAGVPLRAAERVRASERGERVPLVVGGGPCTLNPEPAAEFFDLLVIGDGESAVLDIADLVIGGRDEGLPRRELLRRAAGLAGVYVPSLYERTDGGGVVPIDPAAPERVVRRAESRLTYEGHPSIPIVPVMETTHDRLSVEIMRGCTRGCRFCQPGMTTRPVRQRTSADIVRLVDEGLSSSGYDEVSLISLSTSDHDNLPEAISALNERLFDRRVSISLPSLRAERFGLELADSISRVRRAGLTFAPEAGTQRLRDVINKNETEENILETVDVAFSSGWNRIKLYFMIGLPTETSEDLEGIVDLVAKVRSVARERTKGARINVSVSPFVPRAHTPFQWERQDLPSETREKEAFLRERLWRLKGVKLATRDPEVSFLEGVMSRGDRALAPVIESAYLSGARFDGWTETFDFALWRNAFAERGVSPEEYLAGRPIDEALPWDHIEAGPSREFLLQERARALEGTTTSDCRVAGCFDCGACSPAWTPKAAPGRALPRRSTCAAGASGASEETAAFGRRARRVRRGNGEGTRWRVRYAKGPQVRFATHLDVVRAVLRALAVSGLPVVYTQGFNPHPRLSFGPPLPVGTTGEAEFFDLETTRSMGSDEIMDKLSEGLPDGLSVMGVSGLSSRRSVSAIAEAAEYVISDVGGLSGLTRGEIEARIEATRRADATELPRGDSVRTVRPREQVLELELLPEDETPSLGRTTAGGPPVLRAVLALGREGSMRPVDLVRLLAGEGCDPPELARIHRTALLRRAAGGSGGLEPIT